MTNDDPDQPEPASAKTITALLREARSLSRRADKLSDAGGKFVLQTNHLVVAEVDSIRLRCRVAGVRSGCWR